MDPTDTADQNPQPWSGDALQLARGLMMGGADIVPGVSGGTVALILGIYERLVTALSHFDLKLFELLASRRWRKAVAHVDLRFLVALGGGIVIGVGSLAKLMNYLLLHQPVPTWSLFFGLILASAILVARMIERWSAATALLLVAGAWFAWWLVGQTPADASGSYAYLFFTGAVAICAMILPGISGAYIMLIMGQYEHVTGKISQFVDGLRLIFAGNLSGAADHITADTLLTLILFALGCAVGLLSFSKLLRWLLARHEALTMAVLCGFMFGSLRKIWPFKKDLTPEIEDLKHKLFTNTFPKQFDGEVVLALLLAIGAIVFVLAVDWWVRGGRFVPPLKSQDHATVAERETGA